jgi:hypothetical protein
MNGAEQRERFTAVRRAEKRLDDVEAVTEGLGQVIVDDRTLVAERFRDVAALIATLERALADERTMRKAEIDACETALANEERIRETLCHSVWQRLRWLVGI